MTRSRRRKSNVVALDGGAPPVPRRVPEIVETLNGLLTDAKDGKVVGLAFVAIDAAGYWRGQWMGDTRISQMTGIVGRLQHDMIAAWAKSDE